MTRPQRASSSGSNVRSRWLRFGDLGGIAMAGSLGMALGPVGGGLIYDALATYTWLYVGSAVW